MKIVIETSEEFYEDCKRFADYNEADKVIANGTPLPKGHGRLIDADTLDGRMYHDAFESDSDMQKWDSGCWIRYKMFEKNLEKTPTIIEADKEGAEK